MRKIFPQPTTITISNLIMQYNTQPVLITTKRINKWFIGQLSKK